MTMTGVLAGCVISSVTRFPLDIPVDPDAPHARDLILRELTNPEYQAAKPTWLDIASKAVQDWLASLFTGASGAGGAFAVVGLVVIVCLVVGAIIVFGVPRMNRRRRHARVLLESSDTRTAAQLRADADAAARAADWNQAVADIFRALCADLAERTIITLTPGTTAHEAATRAEAMFGDESDNLRAGAAAFDAVRYLGRTGTPADYERLRQTDARLKQAHPSPALLAGQAVG